MPFTIITTPTVLAVNPLDAMDHTVVEGTDDFDLISQYIKAFTNHGQNLTGRQFVETVFELDLDEFPFGDIELKPNLQSVTSVIYTDGDDVEQTLNANTYIVKTTPLVGYITPVDEWPSDVADPADLKVRFNAGYPLSSNKATTPEDIKTWIMVRVAGIYEQRANFVLSKGGKFGVAPMPRDFVDSILDAYIVPGVGSGV